MAEFPWTAESIREVAARLRSHFARQPTELIVEAQGLARRTLEAKELLESPVPFYFELNPRGSDKQSSRDDYTYAYDVQDRVILICKRNEYGRQTWTVFSRGQSSVDYWVIDDWQAKRQIERVGEVFEGEELGHDISLSLPSNATGYVWRRAQGKVTDLQIWNLRQPRPIFVKAFYENEMLVRLERDGKPVWPLGKERGTSLDAAARRLVDLTRARLQSVREPILLLTLCFEFGNVDYLPPQIGVVFSSDARAFEQEPARYGRDINALLNPTVQESLPFPSQTSFPFVEVRADQLRLSWPAEQLRKNALALAKRMNRLLSATEPPFLVVDLTGDTTAHLDQLPETQRREIDKLVNSRS